MDKMTFTDGVLQVLTELAPLFILFVVVMIIFSWIRIAVDVMSGRGM